MTDFQDKVTALLQLAGKGVLPQEVRSAALDVKQAVSDEMAALWRTIFLIDNFVDFYAPDPQFPKGVLPVPATGATTSAAQTAQPTRVPRGQRVLELARAMAEDGDGTVTGKAIAEQLQREGDQTNIKNLTVAAGNVLARSNEWESVRPGVYKYLGSTNGGL